MKYLRPYRTQVACASLALVMTATITLSVGQGLRNLIDRGLGQDSAAALSQSIVIFGILVLLLAVGTFIRFFFVSWIGERVSADIRNQVFRHIVGLDPGFFETIPASEIQSRVTTDTTILQTVIGSSVSIALRNILMFCGGLALLMLSNLKLSLIVVCSAPLVVAPVILLGRRVRILSRDSQDELASAGFYLSESLRHIKTLQANNQQAASRQTFAAKVEQTFRVGVKRIRQRAVLIALVMTLALAAIVVMIWVGGQDVIAGHTSPGELAAFIFYAFIVAGSVGAISEVYSDLQRAAGAMDRLMEMLATRTALPEPNIRKPLPDTSTLMIEFQDVSFSYQQRPNSAVLRGLSFRVATGEQVALVGPSGAGKSTVFELLLRFRDPNEGVVLFQETDVRLLDLEKMRERIAVVPQEPALFVGSIRANIAFAKPDATAQEVLEAARVCHVLEFASRLPAGLDTEVGEDGAQLSGGQKQRIAVARAVLRKPRLLLLDEATSSLDAESEHMVQAGLNELTRGCTTLVIAHRLATVRGADHILVLDRGRLIAAGTHESLQETCSLYARLATLQFTDRSCGGAAVEGQAKLQAG